MNNDQITELFDKQGNLIGALLTAQAWAEIKPLLEGQSDTAPQENDIVENLEDWESLKTYWDFPYPVDYDVACGHCGNETDNWSEDHPRKFKLTAASLSGLVTFACMSCSSKIIKKHFKDEIVVETYPAQEKDLRKEGRY